MPSLDYTAPYSNATAPGIEHGTSVSFSAQDYTILFGVLGLVIAFVGVLIAYLQLRRTPMMQGTQRRMAFLAALKALICCSRQ